MPTMLVASVSADGPALVAEQLAKRFAEVSPTLLLFFASSRYDIPALAQELSRRFPAARRVGCTTCGELGPAGCASGTVTAAAFAPPWRVGVQFVEDLGAFRFEHGGSIIERLASGIGRRVADLSPERHLLVTFTDGLSGKEEILIASLSHHAPALPLVGGSAGDDFRFERTWVSVDGAVSSHGAAIALLEPNLPFHTFFLHHYRPSERSVIVTAAEPSARLVRRLDGYPATRVLSELLEVPQARLLAEPDLVRERPPVFGLRACGAYHLRSVMAVEGGEALLMGGAIEEGAILHWMRPGDLVEETRRGVGAALSAVPSAEGMLLFNCGGRLWEARHRGVIDALSNAMTQVSSVGFTTYGEQFGPLQVNHTLTGLVLGAPHG